MLNLNILKGYPYVYRVYFYFSNNKKKKKLKCES